MGEEKTARKDEQGGEAATAPRQKQLTLEEMDRLSREEFDALPRDQKQRYFDFMNRENFPTEGEFYGYAQEVEPPVDFGDEGISAYPRAWAIEGGTMVDASEAAKEVGFTIPVGLTRKVWDAYVKGPEGVAVQDEAARLGEILRACPRTIEQGRDGSRVSFPLRVRDDDRPPERSPVTLRAVWERDIDEGPCVTITQPDEENDHEPARVAAKDTLPPGVAEAILDLMSYLWKYHFENADEDESDPEKDRVFRSQLRVDNWLFGHDTEPEGGW